MSPPGADSMTSWRTAAHERLAREPFDVLVIGGGITGAGVARDSALRGLRVALVERDDFASGTSSRSSRLIHGGVRYLEHGYIRLVLEASRERRLLLTLAPDLVRPLRFTWPVYRGARLPRWKVLAGLWLYDLLAIFGNVGRHKALDVRGVLAAEPRLARAGLLGGASYFDAATDDARLTLANVVDAVRAGAVVLNHAEVTALIGEGTAVNGATLHDRLSGHTIDVRATVLVNATGPWTHGISRLENPDAPAAVLGTKGAHIAVPRARVGNRDAITLLSPLDGRVMFVLPSGRHTIIGTTDTPTHESPDEVRASRADVTYLLASVNALFPEARLQPDDVVSAWAGIRPLIASGNAGNPASASREHVIAVGPRGVVAVTGGKLTTYRAMAASVTDVVEQRLGRRVTPSPTVTRPLPVSDTAHRASSSPPGAPGMGTEISPDTPLAPELSYTWDDLRRGIEEEFACTLTDLLVHRTKVAFETRDHGLSLAPRIAETFAPLFGWTAVDCADAVDRYRTDIARLFTINP